MPSATHAPDSLAGQAAGQAGTSLMKRVAAGSGEGSSVVPLVHAYLAGA